MHTIEQKYIEGIIFRTFQPNVWFSTLLVFRISEINWEIQQSNRCIRQVTWYKFLDLVAQHLKLFFNIYFPKWDYNRVILKRFLFLNTKPSPSKWQKLYLIETQCFMFIESIKNSENDWKQGQTVSYISVDNLKSSKSNFKVILWYLVQSWENL